MSKGDQPLVLYVDDEPINLRVFEANFRSRLRVVCCSSGKEALSILNERGNEVGVLLSDQRMPEMTGVELLEKARAMYPDMQRMLLTAYSDIQAVMDAVNRGQVARYFVKPWVKDELLAALEDGLRIYTLSVRLRQMEGRLLQSERLATLGQVSAGIAHELMNPVSYMSQNIAALRAELKMLSDFIRPALESRPNDAVRRTLDDLPQLLADVETGAQHIRQVALGIRKQVRGEESEPYSNLSDVVHFASKLARGEVQHRGRLSVEGPQVQVEGSPVKLTQILLNLIVNAAHALENTGRPGLIQVRWLDEQDKVRLTVKDNGCGISPAIQAKVFDPLFTTKPQGTGLGLAICREMIHQMGGEISLHSQEGEGTTMELAFKKAPVA